MIEGVGGDSGESEWWVAGVGDGCVERGIGKRRRYWPGGGRGGIPLEGIASPGVGIGRVAADRNQPPCETKIFPRFSWYLHCDCDFSSIQ